VVEVGSGGKKTKLFLILGDLAIQLNSERLSRLALSFKEGNKN
jgi:hypothetical protein